MDQEIKENQQIKSMNCPVNFGPLDGHINLTMMRKIANKMGDVRRGGM